MPLEHDARRDPLPDQLEQPAGLLDREAVLGPPLAPGADLADPQDGGVLVPVGGLDLLPGDAGVGRPRRAARRRARRGCRATTAPASAVGPGQQPAPPPPTSIGGRRAPAHASLGADRPLAQGAAVLLEGGELAEHPVVLGRRARPGWCAAAATSARRSGAARSARAAGRRAGATYDASGSLAVSSGSTPSALIAEETAGSVAASRSRVAQPASPAPATGPPAAATSSHTAAVGRVGEVVGADLGGGAADRHRVLDDQLERLALEREPRVAQVGHRRARRRRPAAAPPAPGRPAVRPLVLALVAPRRGRFAARRTSARASSMSTPIMPASSRENASTFDLSRMLETSRAASRSASTRPSARSRSYLRDDVGEHEAVQRHPAGDQLAHGGVAVLDPQVARVHAGGLDRDVGLGDEVLVAAEGAQRGLLPGGVAVEGEDHLAAELLVVVEEAAQHPRVVVAERRAAGGDRGAARPARWQAITSV